jgi:hypothetical protein
MRVRVLSRNSWSDAANDMSNLIVAQNVSSACLSEHRSQTWVRKH